MVLAATGVGHADPADTPLAATDLIINGSGSCLEIENSSTANGANAQQWTCVFQGGANWRIFQGGAPTEWWIINEKSGKCLEVENGWTHNGAPVQQWTCTYGVKHQLWFIDGNRIQNKATGKYLEVENSSGANGARVQQWQYANVRGQHWTWG
ncbi:MULTISPECIES: RICIN domain-containing protein [unclassified Streptomyces]|uniref:RICIN domain-containing protein n=1 Tax=unclassified Streptomyces TaxID=2593676 RepID=UPI0013A68E5F|nr:MULTISPECIES: RICIN domain-containing protein [unclassified Streptomyces]